MPFPDNYQMLAQGPEPQIGSPVVPPPPVPPQPQPGMLSKFLSSIAGIDNSPALGLTLIRNPEAVAGHLAATGVPPPADAPPGATPDDARESIGKALVPKKVPTVTYTNTNAPVTSKDQSQMTQGDPYRNLPSQQGAAEPVAGTTPGVTPNADGVNTSGPPPASDTSKKPGELNKQPKTPSEAASSVMDDLGKALAGVKPIPGPKPTEIRTPEAYRPTNQISRSTLPTALLQQLGNVTKGTTGPYRLGQALAGIRSV